MLHQIDGIHFAHQTISYDLPSDVFEPGEARPIRSKRSKPKSQTKRTATDAGLEVRS